MRNLASLPVRGRTRPAFSPVPLLVGFAATLGVAYVALIAVVMAYAALTVGFSQSVRSDQAQVATLEGQYLSAIASINNTNYSAEGYAKPLAEVYVPGARVTALR